MPINKEILDQSRGEVFEKLGEFKGFGYLVGGTALALQIRHRKSYDFDVFCREEISRSLIKKISEVFSIGQVFVNSFDRFSFLTEDEIKVSFVYYPFDLTEFVVEEEGALISLLSPQGIAVAKVYTLNRRASWRDYLDLFFVLREDLISVEEIIAKAGEVYEGVFSEKLFYSQLFYTDDISQGEIDSTELIDGSVAKQEGEDFFRKLIEERVG